MVDMSLIALKLYDIFVIFSEYFLADDAAGVVSGLDHGARHGHIVAHRQVRHGPTGLLAPLLSDLFSEGLISHHFELIVIELVGSAHAEASRVHGHDAEHDRQPADVRTDVDVAHDHVQRRDRDEGPETCLLVSQEIGLGCFALVERNCAPDDKAREQDVIKAGKDVVQGYRRG